MIDSIELLRLQTGRVWPNLSRSRAAALDKLNLLKSQLSEFAVPDTSVVVFGSLARLEFTPDSDIDWTLLLDGFSIPEHLNTAIAIGRRLEKLQDKKPGREGTFGTLAPSHDLLHHIGGEVDTNANTTRRNLLLLESKPIGNREAYDRVRSNLLKRYLSEDLGLWRQSNEYKIPHLLLNDFARYWRTMAVDFAYKQRSRGNDGFALRNIKLRMSRKLIFIAGLIACFQCHLATQDPEHAQIFQSGDIPALVAFMRQLFEETPLDIIASALIKYEILWPSAGDFFSAYDDFIGLLQDSSKRERLSELTPLEIENDPIYREARAISHKFRQSIESIFLQSDNPIGHLTIRFGVF